MPYKCPRCGEVFKDEDDLDYECDGCENDDLGDFYCPEYGEYLDTGNESSYGEYYDSVDAKKRSSKNVTKQSHASHSKTSGA